MMSHPPDNSTDDITSDGHRCQCVNMAKITYRVSTGRLEGNGGALIDRGANGGIAGDDVRVVATIGKTVKVRGINNLEGGDIPLVTCAGVVQTQKGEAIAIMHNYAHTGKGCTVHSSVQLESYQNDVNDRSVKIPGGLQRITTRGGDTIPIHIRQGLPYISMRPFTDNEWTTLPHLVLTDPSEWDPTILDGENGGSAQTASSTEAAAGALHADFTQSVAESPTDRSFLVSLPHDLGGNHAFFGTIPTDDKHLQPWEQQCHALFAVLATKTYLGTDQLRRAIEDLTPNQYNDWGYYARWTAGMVSLLMESAILSNQELSEALFGGEHTRSTNDITSTSPRYQPGETVRVKSYSDGIEYRRPHIRTPGYIYGVHGKIVDVCGRFGDPSLLAFGILDAPKVWLYRVAVSMSDLWPEQSTSIDTVSVEIYEHWLQPSDTASGRDFNTMKLLNHDDAGRDCVHHDHDDHHHHDPDRHHHYHDHDHHGVDQEDHSHDPRPQVELRAIEREGPPRPGKDLFQALFRIVLEKGMVSRDEVRRMVEALDTAGKKLNGATLVVKAWMDPKFKERLLQNPAQAAEQLGVQTSNPNASTVLKVVENTPKEHNLVVCTLCSCYPSSLLGIAPSWYKSSEFRARAVREPRKVLEDFGTILPPTKLIRVHDSTADCRYLVLPERPEGTEEWSEEELRELITRDSMVGVTTCVSSQ